MTYYEYPNLGTGNFVVQLIQYANTVTNNSFTPIMLLGIFGISFLSLRNFGNDSALSQSSFITTIFAWIMFFTGVASQYVAIVPTVIFLLSIFYSRISD